MKPPITPNQSMKVLNQDKVRSSAGPAVVDIFIDLGLELELNRPGAHIRSPLDQPPVIENLPSKQC